MEDGDACTFNSQEKILTACAMSIHPSRMQHGPQRSSAQDHERWTLLPGERKTTTYMVFGLFGTPCNTWSPKH